MSAKIRWMGAIFGGLGLALTLVLVAWVVSGVLRRQPRPVAAAAATESSSPASELASPEQTNDEGQSPFEESDLTQEQGESESDEGGPSDA